MRVAGHWLEAPETQAVLRLLAGGGHRALAVGGCVRNALMDAPVADIDVATDARPERVAELAEAAGIRAVPTGIGHGTLTLVLEGRPYEVTTFRRDVETDGRRAVVAFTDEVEADARRRDLTINALYAEADGTVIDPLGGLADIRARRIRFVGDPATRIAEDRLRVLRFFRFHAWYGDPEGGLDAAGLAACAAAAGELGVLSRERVGAEVLELLAAPDPAPATLAMAGAGVLAAVLPGADAGALARLVAAERQIGVAPDAIRRLAALGAEDVAERLRLGRVEARRHDHLRGTTAGIGEVAWRHGAQAARDMALVRAAAGAPLPADLSRQVARGEAARFPLRAADMPLEGPALGRALAAAEARWIASDFRLTRDELISGTG